jgi:hypothetical protein
VLLCLVSKASGRRAAGTLALRRRRETIGKDGDIKSPVQASEKPFTLDTPQAAKSKKTKFEGAFVQLSHIGFLILALIPKSRISRDIGNHAAKST